ncbi:MAG: HD-GYP domain-containing protein [Chloroflexota bacterium]
MHLEVEKDLLKSLLVMADVIEARDTYTGGHVWRVSQIARSLALEFGLSEDKAVHVGIGGFLHDLGKVGIPDHILHKKGGLDANEFDVIKTHPLIGARLIEEHPLGAFVRDVILHHHERLDGKGYPEGLDGDALSLPSRIIALADAFDALTSVRPYHKGKTIDEAVSILTQASGSHFDPGLVAALQAARLRPSLVHVVGHSDEGIPLIDCPACGSVFTVRRHTLDGDIVFCRACTGKMIMHKRGDTFDPEFTHQTGAPRDVQPTPDMDVIKDFVARVPKELEILP